MRGEPRQERGGSVDLAPLTSLAAGQHGCFASRQLPSLGISQDQLYRLRKQGLVLPGRHRGVHRFASHAETWRQRVMAATLSMPGSQASHRTAAVLWDREGFRPGKIELLVEHGSWRDRSIIVHQSEDLVGGDYDVVDGIPCTSLIRTLVDLPAVAWETRCGQALDHACREDRSVLKRVRARHLEVARRGRNGTVMLRALLERRGEGDQLTDSGFEDKALHLVSEACLPEPVTQHRVQDGDFLAFIDIAWPERMVGLECDSLAYHFGELAHTRDRMRRRRLKALGWNINEFTYEEVKETPHIVVRDLKKALGI
jgi:hypothetical protein